MHDIDAFDRVVGAIYDAAIQPGLWANAFAAVQGALGCDVFHSFVWDHAKERPALTWASEGVTASVERQYAEHYGLIDPRRILIDHQPVGAVFRCHDHIDERAVARSEFYQDFLIAGGMRYLIGSTVTRSERQETKIAFLRAVGRPSFSDDDLLQARRIVPHIVRAMSLSLREQRNLEALASSEVALQALETGIVLFDAKGSVVFTNNAAQALDARRDGLHLGTDGLQATANSDTLNLRAAWSRLVASDTAQSVRVASDAERPGFSVTLCRLPAAAPAVTAHRARHVAFVRRLNGGGAPNTAQLVQLFGLTVAEARLLQRLAEGRTLEQAARDNGVRASTVRSQLLSVLAKTGCARQVDLLALVARLVPTPG